MGFDAGALQPILLKVYSWSWWVDDSSETAATKEETKAQSPPFVLEAVLPAGHLPCFFRVKACCSGVPGMIDKGTLIEDAAGERFPTLFSHIFVHLKTKDGFDMFWYDNPSLHDQYLKLIFQFVVSSCLIHIAKQNTTTLDMIGLVSSAKRKGRSYDHWRPGLQWLSHRGWDCFVWWS